MKLTKYGYAVGNLEDYLRGGHVCLVREVIVLVSFKDKGVIPDF